MYRCVFYRDWPDVSELTDHVIFGQKWKTGTARQYFEALKWVNQKVFDSKTLISTPLTESAF